MFLKKRYILVYVLTALAGTGMHFLYDLCPNPLFALIAPVNESIWEHLKLLFWPFLAGGWALYTKDRQRSLLGAWMAAVLLMPAALIGMYYTLLCGFDFTGEVSNIALYYIVLAMGFLFLYVHRNSNRLSRLAGVLTMLAAIYASCLLVFSIAAPDFPIFREKYPLFRVK